MAFYYKAIKRGFINDKLYDQRTNRSTVVVEKKFDKCPSWLEPMETGQTGTGLLCRQENSRIARSTPRGQNGLKPFQEFSRLRG